MCLRRTKIVRTGRADQQVPVLSILGDKEARTSTTRAKNKRNQVMHNFAGFYVTVLVVERVKKRSQRIQRHVTVHADPTKQSLEQLLMFFPQRRHLLNKADDDAQLGLQFNERYFMMMKVFHPISGSNIYSSTM